MRKNTLYAVYHQQEIEYLARSYQPGYFFMLMGGEYMTEFLHLDGSKAMKGNLDLDIYNLLQKYWMLKPHPTVPTAQVWLRKADDSNFISLRADGLSGNSIGPGTLHLPISTLSNVLSSVYFRTYDGAAWHTVLRMIDKSCEIPRAGNITPIGNAIKDLGAPANRFSEAFIKDIALETVGFAPGDVLSYDTANNRYLFAIGGVVKGYVDDTGFHNGAP